MPRYSLKRLLLIITLIACGLAFLRAAYIHFTHFETAENVARVDWLPDSASNVSYYKSYNFTAYEFGISEAEFKKWARRWELQPIGEPISIDRYCTYAKSYPNVPWSGRSTEITHGLSYEYRTASSGGVAVAYDRSKGRAYFQSNPR